VLSVKGGPGPGPASATAAALALLLAAGAARAQEEEATDGLRTPERITVGASSSDQFLGQLAPDGKRVYLVSNRNIANEVLWLDVNSGSMKRLFDEGAETTWPRVSADGKRLLYVSFRDRASGQLCLRDLPEGGERRCLDEPGGAIQAEWISPTRIALVSRASIQGDLHLLEVTVGEKGTPLASRPLLERNLASPAITPDGRWLVYVPMERYAERVGSGFAARAGSRLEAVRLDQPDKVWPMAIDLPGLCGQPVFSRDGRFLYFTQFLDDSNRDGVIDAADNGVLFRVPFQGDAADAPVKAAAAFAEQLTDGRRNCQYPAPAAADLVATCSRRDGLDVFKLPLEGMVPSEWPNQRLWDEIDTASRREEQLLFYRHLLGRETVTRQRRRALVRLVLLHLEVDQFAAAELYARRLNELADPTNPGMGRPLGFLVAHRQARNGRDQAGSRFVEKARGYFAELAPKPEEKKAALALGHFVRSEIADDLGDKALARQELEAVKPEEQTSQAVFHVFYLRADAFYRSVGDREGLVSTLRKFATHATLEKEDRCDYARAMVRAMTRGVPAEAADQALAKEQAAGVDADSELGFALELGRAVLAIRNDDPSKEVREALAKIYKKQTRQDRRRAVVLDAVQRASALDAERVIEGLSLLYLEDVPAGSVERRAAVRLYQRATEGRAYRRLAKGRADKALEFFDAVVNKTGSYESLVEWLTLRLEGGATPELLLAELDKRPAKKGSQALRNVAEAFLIANSLPALDGEAHAKAIEKALAALKSTWSELRKDRVAQAIYGEVLHQGFLRSGDVAAAQRASNHYLVALDRARQSPRQMAAILGQLGMLHEQVGNWRIALGYLDEREKMPFLDDPTSLAVRLSRARVLLHVEREEQAAKVAEAALALVEKTPKLAEYRLIALDRAALYSLAAGRFARAVELYGQELPLLAGLPGPGGARNRLAVRLAHAAAAMGAGAPQQTLDDLAEVDRGLADPTLLPTLRWPHSTPEKVLRSYKLIASGLRAKSQAMLGQAEQAQRSLEERRALFEAQLKETEREEDARALALVDAQLADAARDRGDWPAAGMWIGKALQGADGVLTKTGATVDADGLRVLWLASDIKTANEAPVPIVDLARRLREAHQATVQRKDPAMRGYQRWLEVYLAIIGGAEAAGAKDAKDARPGAPR
jgi:hypothetical protein